MKNFVSVTLESPFFNSANADLNGDLNIVHISGKSFFLKRKGRLGLKAAVECKRETYMRHTDNWRW